MPRPSRARRTPAGPLRAVLYTRVSTAEQAADGHGLDAQVSALQSEVDRRGWTVVATVTDRGVSGGKPFASRAGGRKALALLEGGDADVVVVSKLDRLSRSFADAGMLLEQAQRQGWNVVSLDLGLDMSTPAGEMVAGVMASAAQYERRMAGQRTREGLAAARAKGVRLGRPQVLPAGVVARIVQQRRGGMSLPAICAGLEHDRVPTARGRGRWYPSTIAGVLASQAAAAL